MSTDRRCSGCRHFHETECRRNPPQVHVDAQGRASSHWPEVMPNDFCGHFYADIGRRHTSLASDASILAELQQFCGPFDNPEDKPQPATRAQFISLIMDKAKCTRTPAVKRLERMAAAGLVIIGPNPWDSEAEGQYVWTPGAVLPAASAPQPPKDDDFERLFAELCPDANSALPVRSIHSQLGSVKLSVATVHRRLQALVRSGRATHNEVGYHAKNSTAAPSVPEIEVD